MAFSLSSCVFCILVSKLLASGGTKLVCNLISHGTTALFAVSTNKSVWEGLYLASKPFPLPVLMTEKPCNLSCGFRFSTVSQQLEQSIFEYLKDELLSDVVMFHENKHDAQLLSRLLISYGAQIYHINEAKGSLSSNALEHLFSNWTVFDPTNGRRVFISLFDGIKINKLLEFISNKFLTRKDVECMFLPKQQQEIGKAILRDIQRDLIHHHCCHQQDEYIVWKSFVADEGFQSLLPLALYGDDTGLLPIRPAPMKMLTLRVVLVKQSPFVRFYESEGSIVLFDCPLKKIMEFLGQKLHFSYTFLMSPQKEWGRKLGSNWTGAIGSVIRGEGDLIPFIPALLTRLDVIEYTKPIAYTTQRMLVALPKEPTRAFMYIKFYQKEVWILFFLTILAVTYILKKLHACIENPISFPNCFWLIFGSLLQQGSASLPRTSACRIVLAAWWLLVIVITTTYSANLVSFLVSKQSKYVVKSLEELANHDTVTLAINEESPLLEDFKVSQNEVHERIRNVYLKNPHRFHNFTSETWDSKILTDVAAEKTVLIDDIATLKGLMEKQYILYNHCKFAFTPEQFGSVALAFGLRKNSSFLQPINNEIQKLTERGQLYGWESRTRNNYYSEFCGGIDNAASGTRPVEIEDLRGPFYLLLLGAFLGLIILGSETIYSKWSKNSSMMFRVRNRCKK